MTDLQGRDDWPASLRDRVLKIVEALPDEATADDITEALDFILSIERGLADIEAGRVITHEEMLQLVESWQAND